MARRKAAAQQPSSQQERPKKNSPKKHITILHPDLGIGGAERLVLDVALALQARGHKVTIYTSHRDTRHCFEEARDGSLDVRVRNVGRILPAHVAGRFVVAMAVLRQIVLLGWVLGERRSRVGPGTDGNGKNKGKEGEEGEEEVFFVDQVPACVPLLRFFAASGLVRAWRTGSRVLFYCHFPDQLLSRRDEGGPLVRFVKACYRIPFDAFEGWAIGMADKVVANSWFTSGVVRSVFGADRIGDVSVVYPCVDTETKTKTKQDTTTEREGDEVLWGGMKLLLSINRFERKKNIELAIRAYHGLRKEERKGSRLVIAGGYDHLVQENAQYHKELDELATSLGLQTATSKTVVSALSIPKSIDVLFLLSVPSAFKDTLLSSSSLLLYTPSHEHFGIVPVEAMHAALPVLAVNTGGPLETILEGETGWLRDAHAISDWTEVIRKVLRELDQPALADMGRRGQSRVEKAFSLRAMGDSLEMEIDGMFNSERNPVSGQALFAAAGTLGLACTILAAILLALRV